MPRVNRCSDQFLPAFKFSTTLFHLGFQRRFQPFANESDETGLFWGSVSVTPDNLSYFPQYCILERSRTFEDSSSGKPSTGCLWSYHGGMRLQRMFDWGRWHRWCRNSPCTVDRSGGDTVKAFIWSVVTLWRSSAVHARGLGTAIKPEEESAAATPGSLIVEASSSRPVSSSVSLRDEPGVAESSGAELGRAFRKVQEPGAISLVFLLYSTASTYSTICFFPDRLADLLGVELLEL